MSILWIAILMGPVIAIPMTFGSEPVDLRVQDILFPFVVLGVAQQALHPRRTLLTIPRYTHWLVIFLTFASLSLLINGLKDPTIDLVRQAAFYARTFEAVAYLFAGYLVHRSLTDNGTAAFRFMRLGVAANVIWILYQYADNSVLAPAATYLLPEALRQPVLTSYGPSAIGDSSPWTAGALTLTGYIAFSTLTILRRDLGAGISRHAPALAMSALCILATVIVQSRAALAGIVGASLVFVLGRRFSRHVVIVIGAILAWGAAVSPLQDGHLSVHARLLPESVVQSLTVRAIEIWRPLVGEVIAAPILGHGPGSLGTDEIPYTEAHNQFLRFGVEFGLLASVAYLVFITFLASSFYRSMQLNDPIGQFWGRTGLMLIFGFGAASLFQDALVAAVPSHIYWLGLGISLAGSAHHAQGGHPSAMPLQVRAKV